MRAKKGPLGARQGGGKLPDDLLDEVDKFHKESESDSLDEGRNMDQDDSDDVEAVLDLDDSEDDSDADLEAGGKLAKGAPTPPSWATNTNFLICCFSATPRSE